MTEQDPRSEQLHAAADSQGAGRPPLPSMTVWGRRAALIYLGVGALALIAMAIETVQGHAGTATMFAALLSVPWSMIMAGVAPPLPANLSMAAGLAVRMVPLAVFMLLNAAIVAGIAARSERDLAGRGPKTLVLVLLAGLVSSGCGLTSSQRVLVAAPSSTVEMFDAGVVTTFMTFDLSTVPEWRDHRANLSAVSEMTLLGYFFNPGGPLFPVPATDVEIWFWPGARAPQPQLTPGTLVWGPLHLEENETHQVDWNDGARRFTAAREELRRSILGDGQFLLVVSSVLPPATPGGAAVDNFRLGATLQVR